MSRSSLGNVTVPAMVLARADAGAGQDDGMDFVLCDPGHLTHASKRRLHALVSRLIRGGRIGVQLLTDDGRLLDLKSSEKELRPGADAAHVDVTGDLPRSPGDWRAGSTKEPTRSAPGPLRRIKVRGGRLGIMVCSAASSLSLVSRERDGPRRRRECVVATVAPRFQPRPFQRSKRPD